MGWDQINYTKDCETPTADLLMVKLLLNSIVSTLYASFMTVDIKNFNLNTSLKHYKYLHLKLEEIPNDVKPTAMCWKA